MQGHGGTEEVPGGAARARGEDAVRGPGGEGRGHGELFPLPTIRPPFVHRVLMHEHDDFQPRTAVHGSLPGTSSDSGVLLHEDNGLLRVQLTVTPNGLPRRGRRPPAVRLAPGDWLRWQINYRFAGTHGGEWTYRLDTLNIANGAAPTDLFLGAPIHHVTELATLR